MTYPAITRKSAQSIAGEILAALESASNPLEVAKEDASSLIELRNGPDYDRQAVELYSKVNRKLFLVDVPDDQLTTLGQDQQTKLEADMAGPTHAVLGQLEVVLLQDPDFWRYLALYPLRWYLLAREPELQPQDFGGTVEILDDSGNQIGLRGTDMKKQLILRTYLWGKCAFDAHDSKGGPGEPYRRATAISGEGLSPIDVWHSHMVRVQVGQLGEIPHAFIDVVTSPPAASTDDARQLEKLLTRMKHNILLDSYDYEGAVALVQGQLPTAKVKAKAAKKASRKPRAKT